MPGAAQVPLQFRLGPLSTISIGIGLLARGGKGATYRKSKLPDQPIEIWGYEASPFVKLAREVRLGSPLDLLPLPPHQTIPCHVVTPAALVTAVCGLHMHAAVGASNV